MIEFKCPEDKEARAIAAFTSAVGNPQNLPGDEFVVGQIERFVGGVVAAYESDIDHKAAEVKVKQDLANAESARAAKVSAVKEEFKSVK